MSYNVFLTVDCCCINLYIKNILILLIYHQFINLILYIKILSIHKIIFSGWECFLLLE